MVQKLSYWKVLTRRKFMNAEGEEEDTKLNRVLGLFDLTALGVGSTLGAGVYVLAGQIAKDQAGPSVILSFAIAALASLLAGVCYAEFGARVPKAGSAYVYSYVCIGEFVAFVIGWNLILEYIIGTASVCRGISLYLDTMLNDTLKTTFAEIAPMDASFLGSYFDFFAFALVVVFGVALAFGVEASTMANNCCTCLNISILLFVIIAGSIKANFSNWTIDATNVTAPSNSTSIGSGGFFPFGFTGTLKGAATCFFGFVGFDCIATTGEEVRNPRKNIPRSILYSLLIIFLCYFGVSTVLTLMVPYYEQDPNAPLPYAFKAVGWEFAMWIVAIGGLIGLLASLMGALYPLPRVMYSMAEDGLLFRFLGKISERYRVPVTGSIFAAMLTAVIAGLFDLHQLVSLLSIGTLLAYSVVAISVTILRFMDNSNAADIENCNQLLSENSMLTSSGTRVTCSSLMMQLFNFKRLDVPNSLSTRIVGTLITLFCLLSLGMGLIFMQAYDALIHDQIWVLVLLPVLVVLTLLVLLAIALQPREAYTSIFRVPFVPLLPALSIFINIYLMLQFDQMTWIRFGVWMVIGIPMFIACWCMYDIKNPAKRNPNRIEYEKVLKSSPRDTNTLNGHLKANDGTKINGTKAAGNGPSNSTSLTTQNEHTVKSLDEIMNLNEVSEDLIEMKHPNGKIFYVEDTKSNTSTATLERDDERKMGAGFDGTDEEKSVIAMLDDMLQAEDDGVPTSPAIILDYSRKISVDSEMLPSVIESTTVAMVHSSSDSSENDLEVVHEEVNDANKHSTIGSSNASLNMINEAYKESQIVAEKLIDDILSSEALFAALEKHKIFNKLEETKKRGSNAQLVEALNDVKLPAPVAATPQITDKIKRSPSEASILTANSVEDPMHSEQFRNKLSLLIISTPAQVSSSRPTLKHSKSETDVRQLVLSAIEGTGTNVDNSEGVGPRKTPAENGIPKPPKFDPVLYNTINNLRLSRDRPSLNKMLQKSNNKTPQRIIAPVEEVSNDSNVPFKLKLEAVLKRGPSHRTQKQPHVGVRRPKSMISTSPLEEAENAAVVVKSQSEGKSLGDKSEGSIREIPDVAQVINNARKSLKHVKNDAIKL